jgi:hypothetical protein
MAEMPMVRVSCCQELGNTLERFVPRSRRWTTEIGPQEGGTYPRGTSKWEPTLAFPKAGAHRATIGDRLFAEVHIDIKVQQERDSATQETFDGAGTRTSQPFIESIVYDYLGIEHGDTLVIRETSRQGDRLERSVLYVRLAVEGPTRIRFASGVVSVIVDDEQVAVVRWLGA